MRNQPLSRLVAAALGVALALGASVGQAGQFVLVDMGFTQTSASHPLKASPGVPANWLEPVNYAEGTVYIRLEVLSKPSDKPVKFQFSVFGTASGRGPQNQAAGSLFEVTKPGVYEWHEPLPNFWNHVGIDWSRGLNSMRLIVKDSALVYIDDTFDRRLYYPMELNIRVTLVSKGEAFDPYWEIEGLRHEDLKYLTSLVSLWKQGQFGQVLQAAEGELKSKTPERAAEARSVIAAMTAFAERGRAAILADMPKDPAAAIAKLAELGKQFLPAKKGEALLHEAEGWQRLMEMRQLEKNGKALGAASGYEEIARKYAGLEPAAQAKSDLSRLRGSRQYAADKKEVAARDALQAAEQRLADKDYVAAHQAFQSLIAKYAGTAAAKDAKETLARMEADPDIMQVVRQTEAARRAQNLLDIGRNLARTGNLNQAKEYFQKVVSEFPGTDYAAQAQAELNKLPK